MENRHSTPGGLARNALIGTGYLGLVGMMAGIFVTAVNRYGMLGAFSNASEISGITLLAAGAALLVVSAFAVWKWFREQEA